MGFQVEHFYQIQCYAFTVVKIFFNDRKNEGFKS